MTTTGSVRERDPRSSAHNTGVVMTDRRLSVIALTLAMLLIVPTAHAQITTTSVRLTWTAPGDDSLSGTATAYDLRMSTSPIDAGNFGAAAAVTGLPTPLAAGTSQNKTITGLTPSTGYWFALKTRDDAGNWSGISNIVQATTLDVTDFVRPAPLSIAAGTLTSTSVQLTWSAVGDDSLSGTASSYEFRRSTAPITEGNWASATAIPGEPAPAVAGTSQNLTVSGLDRSVDLYFAAKVTDDEGNVSAVSNSLVVPRLLDTAPPATPAGLAAVNEAPAGVRVQWNDNSEADLAGYRVYRAVASGGPFSLISGASLVSASEYVDASHPDSAALWYQVSAVDDAGNESARSAAFRLWLAGEEIVAWALQPAYPNPSPLASSVTLPLEVPSTGPFEGTLEITNSAGERVRRMTLAGLSPGAQSVQWDGLNDAGRRTAPGVYRAWLVVGSRRDAVKIVRTP